MTPSRLKNYSVLHDQNKSGFFGGPVFIQPIRAIWKVFWKLWLAGKKPALQKSHFCFDHVNRIVVFDLWTELESRPKFLIPRLLSMGVRRKAQRGVLFSEIFFWKIRKGLELGVQGSESGLLAIFQLFYENNVF